MTDQPSMRGLECSLKGVALLREPKFNKGSAHPKEERDLFGLTAHLPANEQTLEEQAARAYQQFSGCNDALAKNVFMTSMYEQNQVLYFKLIQDHLKEMFPIIYTPTEGDAIANFSRLFRRSAGCFLTVTEPERVEGNLRAMGEPGEFDYIVVSDGEQILGIGDQGVGGILISVAKNVLMTVCGALDPNRTLAVVLDCGTNNKELLEDELYLGLKQPRIRGQQYDDFVETFVQSARKAFPHAYIHFEDFALPNARRILDKYRSEVPCFNDDVQGTGCVTLAAVIAALRIAKVDITDARVVLFGSGTAGMGIAEQIRDHIAGETHKSKGDAMKQIWPMDKLGLLTADMDDKLTHAQQPFARQDITDGKSYGDLLSVVKHVKPHVLVGTSTQPGAFTQQVVEEMAKHVDRPIILPLSNPTRLHEAVPKDLIKWTDGRALVATGSPFPAVNVNGKDVEVAECNNSVCFPGLGLGAVNCKAKLMTDTMLAAAVKALAAESPSLQDPTKGLIPDVEDAVAVSVKIAVAVMRQAKKEGQAGFINYPDDEQELQKWIEERLWHPQYRPLVRV